MIDEISLQSKKQQELIDITSSINTILKKSKVEKGICNIFVPHATSAIVINENADKNIEKDFFSTLNKIIPKNNNYLHDKIDNNAQAHILSSILKPSVTIPIENNNLQLGNWQAIMLAELDGPRKRRVIISIIKDN